MDTNLSKFDQFYLGHYGERWTGLKKALLHPAEKILRPCFGDFAGYRMDAASIEAALALDVQAGDHVLDMCAAPGGKALILAEKLGKNGSLVANELSSARRFRLKEVIKTHVPEAMLSQFQVTSFDANVFGLKKPNTFDRILLDAPCSSEQHLLEEDAEQKDWKESRTKQLAMRQYSLICSALLALKPGGMLVYSTCSISPLENDGVIERLLIRKKQEAELALDGHYSKAFEKTKSGVQIFPDVQAGKGPIYFSRIRKLPT